MTKTLRTARALRRLDALARDPALTTPERQAALARWLEAEKMGRPRVSDGPPLAIRLDAATRARLDALRTTLVPGLEVTLAQVVRAALSRGLDEMESNDFRRLHATAGQPPHGEKQGRSRRK
jgi:predicted DNA-binding protein